MNLKSSTQGYKQVFTPLNNHQVEYVAFTLNHHRQITHFHIYTHSHVHIFHIDSHSQVHNFHIDSCACNVLLDYICMWHRFGYQRYVYERSHCHYTITWTNYEYMQISYDSTMHKFIRLDKLHQQHRHIIIYSPSLIYHHNFQRHYIIIISTSI